METIRPNSYDRWIKVNLMHYADSRKIELYLDGKLALRTHDNGHDLHAFKCGAYS